MGKIVVVHFFFCRVYRSGNGPVLEAASIAKFLEDSIILAGLGGQGFSAKSFRPTGTTSAIEQGINPEVVRKVGRWQVSEVFLSIMHMPEPKKVSVTMCCKMINRSYLRVFFHAHISRSILDISVSKDLTVCYCFVFFFFNSNLPTHHYDIL